VIEPLTKENRMETLNAHMSPTGKSGLPGEQQLTAAFDWAEHYVKIPPLQEEVRQLEAELSVVRKRPRDKASTKAALRDLFEQHKQRRVEALSSALYLATKQGRLHSLAALRDVPAFRNSPDLGVNFSLEELESAADAMSDPKDAISDKERGKQLRSLTEKRDKCIRAISQLEAELSVDLELADRFCDHWRSVQSRHEEPVDIHGKPIERPDEKEAWRTLGLREFMGKRRPKGQGKIRTSPAIGLGPRI
jgi:uncharacterized coiled-coil DUF342 family protein